VPTHEELPRFLRDWERLGAEQRRAFLSAHVCSSLVWLVSRSCRSYGSSAFRERVQGEPGVWEMTWAADGRATFSYGAEVVAGQPHVIWRRVGTHDVFRRP